eukprot:3940847-Rhodomonas_salina.2
MPVPDTAEQACGTIRAARLVGPYAPSVPGSSQTLRSVSTRHLVASYPEYRSTLCDVNAREFVAPYSYSVPLAAHILNWHQASHTPTPQVCPIEQYRASHSTRVGRYHHALSQYLERVSGPRLRYALR